jgi:hypothetical protein
MPPLALVAGLVLLTAVLRRFRGREVQVPRDSVDLSQEDETMLAEAMDDLRASEEVPF